MDWFEIVKTGADIGFIILCAGFVLWELHDMYINKKKKDVSVSSRIKEMEEQVRDVENISEARKLVAETGKLLVLIKENGERICPFFAGFFLF